MSSYYYLSQSDLTLLETCPPQFQKIYLEKQREPRSLRYQAKAQWGKSFHLLMQQYHLGLAIASLAEENPQLVKEAEALIAQTQHLWSTPQFRQKEAEYQLNYVINNYLFTVIYDLVILYDDRALILDWKTYRQPENIDKLINNWQPKLYLYILAEKLNYLPEQISFQYWFVASANKIENYTIAYNDSWHQTTHQELNLLLAKFEEYLHNYQEQKIDFPHKKNCLECPYYALFPETNNQANITQNITSFDDIEAIEI